VSITVVDGQASPNPEDVVGAQLGTADTDFTLRAERSPAQNPAGRTYDILYRATDLAGNSADLHLQVVVPRSP
jgi:hypothetical protein